MRLKNLHIAEEPVAPVRMEVDHKEEEAVWHKPGVQTSPKSQFRSRAIVELAGALVAALPVAFHHSRNLEGAIINEPKQEKPYLNSTAYYTSLHSWCRDVLLACLRSGSSVLFCLCGHLCLIFLLQHCVSFCLSAMAVLYPSISVIVSLPFCHFNN